MAVPIPLEAWVKARVVDGWGPKALLTAIARPGDPVGPEGRRRPMSEGLAQNICACLRESGVATPAGRTYFVELVRWHLGFSRTTPAYSTAKLKPVDAAFIRQRAYKTLDGHRDMLPALEHDHEAPL